MSKLLLSLVNLLAVLSLTNGITLNSTLLQNYGYNKSSRSISLKSKSINRIDPNAFDGFKSLTSLDLSNNDLNQVDLEAFANISQLTYLNLDSNGIKSVVNPKNVKLESLQWLDMSNNNLYTADTSIFKAMENLRELRMVGTVKHILGNQFSTLPKLKNLTITASFQYMLNQRMFYGLSNIETLRFVASDLKDIEANTFVNLNNLVTLDLSRNWLLSLDGFLVPKNVQNLLMHENHLTILDFENNSNTNLVLLDLANNRLMYLDTTDFSFFPNIKTLILNNNPIDEADDIYKSLVELSNLQYLHLEKLTISRLNKDFVASMTRLRQLNVQSNIISNIEIGTFDKLVDLEEIILNSNHLIKISNGTFVGLPKLKKIYLTHNSINEIEPGAFRNLPALKYVYLSYNSLTKIDNSTFKDLPSLRKIYLDGNPNILANNSLGLCPTANCHVIF